MQHNKYQIHTIKKQHLSNSWYSPQKYQHCC